MAGDGVAVEAKKAGDIGYAVALAVFGIDAMAQGQGGMGETQEAAGDIPRKGRAEFEIFGVGVVEGNGGQSGWFVAWRRGGRGGHALICCGGRAESWEIGRDGWRPIGMEAGGGWEGVAHGGWVSFRWLACVLDGRWTDAGRPFAAPGIA